MTSVAHGARRRRHVDVGKDESQFTARLCERLALCNIFGVVERLTRRARCRIGLTALQHKQGNTSRTMFIP
jgi:hypothetical protein